MGGFINSIAGGGSFITFPALLFVGVPPVAANATNTFASCFGYISGAYAFRKELAQCKSEMPSLVLTSVVGGGLGAFLLLQIPEAGFREAIPWLLLFASVLFVSGSRIYAALKSVGRGYRHSSVVGKFLLLILLVGVCLYGGFFNAGLGIILLSYLTLAGYQDIHMMNGVKLLVSSLVSISAIILFVMQGAIVWYQGMTVLAGAMVGGYFAGHYSRTIPQELVRYAVVIAGFTITLYYFYETYLV